MGKGNRRGRRAPYWDEQTAAGKLREWEASGMSRRRFATKEGVSVHRLNYWAGRLGLGVEEAVGKEASARAFGGITFVEAEMAPSFPCRLPDELTAPLELHTPAGFKLVFPANMNRDRLQMLLELLRESC